jgi:hypothetical protein
LRFGHGVVFAAAENNESQANEKKNKNFPVHNKPPFMW